MQQQGPVLLTGWQTAHHTCRYGAESVEFVSLVDSDRNADGIRDIGRKRMESSQDASDQLADHSPVRLLSGLPARAAMLLREAGQRASEDGRFVTTCLPAAEAATWPTRTSDEAILKCYLTQYDQAIRQKRIEIGFLRDCCRVGNFLRTRSFRASRSCASSKFHCIPRLVQLYLWNLTNQAFDFRESISLHRNRPLISFLTRVPFTVAAQMRC